MEAITTSSKNQEATSNMPTARRVRFGTAACKLGAVIRENSAQSALRDALNAEDHGIDERLPKMDKHTVDKGRLAQLQQSASSGVMGKKTRPAASRNHINLCKKKRKTHEQQLILTPCHVTNFKKHICG